MSYTEFLADEAATLALGKRCATLFCAPATVYLHGDLGAGKTTFVRGFLQGLGYTGTVKSPTYAVVESYELPEKTIHHFDLYRFSTQYEWHDAGLDELFGEHSLCFIEWAEQGGEHLPQADWEVRLSPQNSGRHAHIITLNPKHDEELARWQN